jgi:DNA topoisomerase VI subunit B
MTSLERTTFTTSRLLEFCTRKELTIQTGQPIETWPIVVLKELIDNALDAAEEAGTPPRINVSVGDGTITVADNGPGIPSKTVNALLDFSVRVSSREAYVSPTRGAQGNALKTILAMPFVLDGTVGRVEIAARGTSHAITFKVDTIRQMPVIGHDRSASPVKNGTRVTVHWPKLALLNPGQGRASIFTNCRRLHLAEPPPRSHGRLERQAAAACTGIGHGLAEVASLRSDLSALVRSAAA